jgi:dUTPase
VPAPQYVFRAVDELSETERGDKGFGSSGVR